MIVSVSKKIFPDQVCDMSRMSQRTALLANRVMGRGMRQYFHSNAILDSTGRQTILCK
jgi:hypothetical protein